MTCERGVSCGEVRLPFPPLKGGNVNSRNQSLDVLRGVAILLVLGRHFNYFPLWRQAGWIGVDLFFVLSGFLISRVSHRGPGSWPTAFRNKPLSIAMECGSPPTDLWCMSSSSAEGRLAVGWQDGKFRSSDVPSPQNQS